MLPVAGRFLAGIGNAVRTVAGAPDRFLEPLDVFGTRKRFLRGFRMYLVGCAALFYVRDTSVGQWVLSKGFKGKVYKGFRF